MHTLFADFKFWMLLIDVTNTDTIHKRYQQYRPRKRNNRLHATKN
jgi:hypothetical protein